MFKSWVSPWVPFQGSFPHVWNWSASSVFNFCFDHFPLFLSPVTPPFMLLVPLVIILVNHHETEIECIERMLQTCNLQHKHILTNHQPAEKGLWGQEKGAEFINTHCPGESLFLVSQYFPLGIVVYFSPSSFGDFFKICFHAKILWIFQFLNANKVWTDFFHWNGEGEI